MRAYFLILFTLIVSNLISQNLVRNHDFSELFDWQERNLKQGFYKHVKWIAPFWKSPTRGTADFYCCADKNKRISSVPENVAGYSLPKSGLGYIGLTVANQNFPHNKHGNFREYIRTELTESLIKGSFYCVGFHVKRANKFEYQTKNIGAYLSEKDKSKLTKRNLKVSPQIENHDIIIDDNKWHLIQGVYKAKGKEKFLTIGNFDDFNNTVRIDSLFDKKSVKHLHTGYVFIDDVFVYPIKDTSECSCKKDQFLAVQEKVKVDSLLSEETFSPGKQITLPDITFEVNKSDLSEKVFPLLDSLADYLEDHSKYKLTIEGHTDKVGSEEHNKQLSLERAKSVKLYLESKGIEEYRIKTFGKGSEDPIADNNSKEGQQKNRRVEIIIFED